MMKNRDWFDDFMDYKLSSASKEQQPTAGNQQSVAPYVIGGLVLLCVLLKGIF